jgi:uncharacterized protein YciI
LRTVTALLPTVVALTTIAFAQAPAAPAGPPAPLYAAVYKTGPKWDAAKPPGEQASFKEHSAHLSKLRAAGTIVMGARYADVGLIVVSAPTEADARKIFEADPSVAAGTFAVDVHRFSVFYSGFVGTPPK